MCCTPLAGNTECKKLPKIRHLCTIAQFCWVYLHNWGMYRQSVKNVKQQYLLHTFSQYGKLRPISGWDWFTSLGHPSDSNGFWLLASLVHRRHSTEVNHTLHNVWPLPGLVHYIHIFGGSSPLTEFYQVQNSLSVQVLRSPVFAALVHGTRVVGVSQTLPHSAEAAAYIWQGGHHVGHRPTFQFVLILPTLVNNREQQTLIIELTMS